MKICPKTQSSEAKIKCDDGDPTPIHGIDLSDRYPVGRVPHPTHATQGNRGRQGSLAQLEVMVMRVTQSSWSSFLHSEIVNHLTISSLRNWISRSSLRRSFLLIALGFLLWAMPGTAHAQASSALYATGVGTGAG